MFAVFIVCNEGDCYTRMWCRFTSSCLATAKKLMQGRSKMISGKYSDVQELTHSYWL